MNNIIILPLELDNDDRKVYSFTLEFSRRVQAEILILTTYNEPSDYLNSENDIRKANIKEKEKIHFRMLALMGYYQDNFNQWQGETTSKVKTIISQGNLEIAISKAITDNKDSILVLQRNHYSKIGLSEGFINKLLLTRAKIIMLPVDLDYFEPTPSLDGRLFNIQRALLFNRLLKNTEIYNMPEDISIFKRDSIQTVYL